MIALRKKGQALRRGGCQVLYAEDNVVVSRLRAQSAACTGGNEPWRAVKWCYPRHRRSMLRNGNARRSRATTDGILQALPAISATADGYHL
ncbi:hypothetical protein ACNKHM_05180 [Shigella sonnei]